MNVTSYTHIAAAHVVSFKPIDVPLNGTNSSEHISNDKLESQPNRETSPKPK